MDEARARGSRSDGDRRLHVVVVDDHRLMRDALRLALGSAADMTVVAEAASPADVAALRPASDVDVALVDLDMPRAEGFLCLRWLRRHRPAVASVALAADTAPGTTDAALAAGACAVVAKTIAPEDLAPAIRTAVQDRLVAPLVVKSRAREDVALTARQLAALRGLARGLSNKEIAREMCVAERTVRQHLASAYRKLGVFSRSGALRVALARGLAEGLTPGRSRRLRRDVLVGR